MLPVFFPFLRWFPLSRKTLHADLIAGITVALVLIPQSMAYAQLAGLPAYYGLYAAFLPVIVGALVQSTRDRAGAVHRPVPVEQAAGRPDEPQRHQVA
ncbi:SulP family inorganic anion transporter [Polaromonas sp.]|uniref:SulP family inorganic anion transporter n=1 Tax=Polaromonas sp. TaxID=1869339 RepID=UPI0024886D83|nr:SulP family inorganic anion transporter [Polaromonas sp.]MDI1339956.1 SulP family inorganic anion transporter [Polaromonas sp.]